MPAAGWTSLVFGKTVGFLDASFPNVLTPSMPKGYALLRQNAQSIQGMSALKIGQIFIL